MDPQYLNTLKDLNTSNPKKVKIENNTNKEQILMERQEVSMTNIYMDLIREIFIQSGEIETLPKGKIRDMQILRLGIMAETDASNLYEKLASLTNDKRVEKIMLDISREEKVHFGEFNDLLESIDPEYKKAKEEGKDEVEELMR